jgi:hypothetical protein
MPFDEEKYITKYIYFKITNHKHIQFPGNSPKTISAQELSKNNLA